MIVDFGEPSSSKPALRRFRFDRSLISVGNDVKIIATIKQVHDPGFPGKIDPDAV
jgi:hypothetical protein